jgi:hypothetical protein
VLIFGEDHLALGIAERYGRSVLVGQAEVLDVVYAGFLANGRVHQAGIQLGRVVDRQAILLAEDEGADGNGHREQKGHRDDADEERALAHQFRFMSKLAAKIHR